jgi:hypothetical protein
MEAGAEPEWQLLRAAVSHLRRHGGHCNDMDLTQLQLAVQCLHAPQRLCVALGLPAGSVDCADAASAVTEASIERWLERAVVITDLVQQLVVVLLTSMQVRVPLPLCCDALRNITPAQCAMLKAGADW